MNDETADNGERQIGTTRGGQPIESGTRSDHIEQDEAEHEQELSAGRTRIGTTRGSQPIED
jgi:hypothetical protein